MRRMNTSPHIIAVKEAFLSFQAGVNTHTHLPQLFRTDNDPPIRLPLFVSCTTSHVAWLPVALASTCLSAHLGMLAGSLRRAVSRSLLTVPMTWWRPSAELSRTLLELGVSRKELW